MTSESPVKGCGSRNFNACMSAPKPGSSAVANLTHTNRFRSSTLNSYHFTKAISKMVNMKAALSLRHMTMVLIVLASTLAVAPAQLLNETAAGVDEPSKFFLQPLTVTQKKRIPVQPSLWRIMTLVSTSWLSLSFLQHPRSAPCFPFSLTNYSTLWIRSICRVGSSLARV